MEQPKEQAELKPSTSTLGLEPQQYEAVEQEFQEVLTELAGDRALERFRLEYERLYRALKKSHDSEKRLGRKCRELNAEIVASAAKVATALKLSEEDQATIVALKREIEKSWRLVDAAHEKEAASKDAAAALRAEVAELRRAAEAGGNGGGLGPEEEAALAELLRHKEALARERDEQVDQIVAMRRELAEVAERARALEAERDTMANSIAEMRQQISEKRAEAEREARKRERLEREARDLKAAVEARAAEAAAKHAEAAAAAEAAERLEGGVREARAAAERTQKECNALAEKAAKLQADLEAAARGNGQLEADNGARRAEIAGKQRELEAAQAELARINKVRDAALKKAKASDEAREAADAARDELRGRVAALERDLAAARHDADAERRRMEDLARERDVLMRMRSTAEDATARQADLVRVAEASRKNLENEIAGYRAEGARTSKAIWALEREREQLASDAAAAAQRHREALDDLRAREAAIVELQRRIADGEGRLKQQQALYESVRADRNVASKALIEAQDEVSELRRKAIVAAHAAEQLREEIGAKDLALVKEHFDRVKIEKEKDALRLELDKAKRQIAEADAVVGAQRSEAARLRAVVAEADAERLRQRKEHDLVAGERDVLGSQLVRRNDELALVYEKVKLQNAALARGAVQYRDRVSEIRALKVRLTDLRSQLHALRAGAAGAGVLRREVAALGRALLAERAKVRALSDELECPLNVHRWRKLEGSDPGAYEMLQKIQALQRRLIAKSEEAAEKDALILEKERLYGELKALLARRPGPEAAQQAALYAAALRDKTRQLKALAGELNMARAQVAEHKYEIGRLQEELGALRARWVEASRRKGGGGEATAGGKDRIGAGGLSSSSISGIVSGGGLKSGGAGSAAAAAAGVAAPRAVSGSGSSVRGELRLAAATAEAALAAGGGDDGSDDGDEMEQSAHQQ